MMDKFKNKYTIKSARLENYDYSQNGMYFVTICTKDKEHFFGEIADGKMELNETGKIIKEELLLTPKIRKNVILDKFVIMPNHLHIIVEITHQFDVETPRRGVSTQNKRGGYNPQWKPNSLGSIINQFKSVCTKRIWKLYSPLSFAWQSRFYDRVIRNEIELNRIREYIFKNPTNWEHDRNNQENLFM